MKSPKKLMGVFIMIGLFFVFGITVMAVTVNEVMTSLIMSERSSNITEDMLEGLPDWITIEMVSAAVEMMNETGYPASVVLGQMILESGAQGSGLSAPPYYNCLGLKSPSYNEKGTVIMGTDEAWGYEPGASFSTFHNYVDCMMAWGHRFTMPPYVANVNSCPRDPVTGHYDADKFIEAIWRSGYATDPNYVSKVIGIMTTYNLYRFNDLTTGEFEVGGSVTGSGQFTHPCPGMTYQSSYFGEIREFEVGGHKGHDYAAPIGTPTLAADDGVVIIAGWSDSAGNWVVIDHGNGLTSKYMHHSRIVVSQGQKVRKGQKIGEVGSTGQSTGPHLHFQVEENGVAVNPDKYLK